MTTTVPTVPTPRTESSPPKDLAGESTSGAPVSPFKEAYESALRLGKAEVVPLRYFADDRGYSLMNLFTGVLQEGQCNYSVLYPGIRKAWHRHRLQTDFWVVLSGMAKLGVFDESRQDEPGYRGQTFVVGDRNPCAGLTCVGSEPCGLLYYVTRAYDPASPDEERRAHDSFGSFNWEVEHK
jgi:dTDP-4-dehydrorhamnose 3,5-epimerase-like enzyme